MKFLRHLHLPLILLIFFLSSCNMKEEFDGSQRTAEQFLGFLKTHNYKGMEQLLSSPEKGVSNTGDINIETITSYWREVEKNKGGMHDWKLISMKGQGGHIPRFDLAYRMRFEKGTGVLTIVLMRKGKEWGVSGMAFQNA